MKTEENKKNMSNKALESNENRNIFEYQKAPAASL
jgi:hypothetical protein